MSHLLASTCSSERPLLPSSEGSAEELARSQAGSLIGGSGAWGCPDSSLRHRDSLEMSSSLHLRLAGPECILFEGGNVIPAARGSSLHCASPVAHSDWDRAHGRMSPGRKSPA